MLHSTSGFGVLAALIVAATCAIPPAPARAEFPDHPLKLVVGFSPGSAADIAGRLFAEGLGETIGQRIVIENKPGAAGTTAAESMLRTEPDGYTLVLTNVANVLNPLLKKGTGLDIAKDLTSVAMVCSLPNILVVGPHVKASNVRELIALAKAEPGKLLYGSSGHGTAPHLSGELFQSMAGVKLVHVPYTGSAQPVQDVIGGRIHMIFAPVSTVLGQIEAGSVHALAWTSLKRGAKLPDLPTADESGLPGFDTSIWFGLSGPPKLPSAVRDRIADAAARAVVSDRVAASFRAQGIEPMAGGPAAYQQHIVDETKKWASVIENAGLGRL